MSTKIYNGFIFKAKTYKNVIRDLLSAKNEYSKSLEKRGEYNDIMLNLKVNFEPNDKKNSGDWYRAIVSNKTTMNDCGMYRRGVFVYFDDVTKRFYGYYIGSVEFKFLEKYTKDFHYQNQSDRPDKISDEKWEERKEIWDRLIPYYLHEKGIFFQMYDPESDLEFGLIRMTTWLSKKYE